LKLYDELIILRLGLAAINLLTKSAFSVSTSHERRRKQDTENEVVWDSYRSLKVVGNSTIR